MKSQLKNELQNLRNKIEHRMFSYISMNWRGKPLTSYQVIVNYLRLKPEACYL